MIFLSKDKHKNNELLKNNEKADVFKIFDDSDDYGLIFSTNKRDYVSNDEFEKIIEDSAPNNINEFFQKELLFFTYEAESLLDVPEPTCWLGFLQNYYGVVFYEKSYETLDFEKQNQIKKVIEYLCLQFINYFEILKNPCVVSDEKADVLFLGYNINNSIHRKEFLTEEDKIKNYIYVSLHNEKKTL